MPGLGWKKDPETGDWVPPPLALLDGQQRLDLRPRRRAGSPPALGWDIVNHPPLHAGYNQQEAERAGAGAPQGGLGMAVGPVRDLVHPQGHVQARQARAQNRKCIGPWWVSYLPKRLPKLPSLTAVILVWVLTRGEWSGPLGGVGKMVSSVAGVTDSAGKAAGAALDAGANLTSVAVEVAVAAAANTLKASEEAWRGVDLVGAALRSTEGEVAVEDAEQLRVWLGSTAGKAAVAAPDNFTAWTVEVMSGVGVSTPHVHSKRHAVEPLGSFEEWDVELRVLPSGYVAMQWRHVALSFRPQWANPLWESLSCPVESEAQQILDLAQRTVAAAGLSRPRTPLIDENLATAGLPLVVSARLRLWMRRFALAAKAVWQWFVLPPGA